MKIKYNGMELETITEGYWPEGVTLLHSDDGVKWREFKEAVCIAKGVAVSIGWQSGISKYFAVKPEKTVRRLTNREVAELCKKGWDVLLINEVRNEVRSYWRYTLVYENKPCDSLLEKLRAPGSDEWREPTTELLEVK